MILDCLENGSRYAPLHPGFQAAFDYLKRTSFEGMTAGRHDVDGERLFVVVNRGAGRGHAGAKLESHRKYIDIQYTLSGTDEIGWKPTAACQEVSLAFDAQKDVALYADRPEAWVAVPPGKFTIFYPEDAHAPMGAECDLLKAVVKVAVDWR